MSNERVSADLEAAERRIAELVRSSKALRESEEKYRGLFQRAQVGIVRSRLDGTAILDVNQKLTEILGYTKEEMLASPATIMWADQARRAELIERLRAHGQVVDFEAPIRTKSGDIRSFLVSARIDPAAAALDASIVDITDLRHTEADLRNGKERYASIIATATDGFWAVSPAGKLLEVNDAYVAMSGYSRDELLSMSVSELEEAQSAAEIEENIAKIMRQGYARFETKHRRKDGTVFDVEVSTKFSPAGGGQFVVFLRDISERKHAETALRESEARYRTLAESSVDAIFIVGRDQRMRYVNRAGAAMFGRLPEELSGLAVRDIFPPETLREIGPALAQVFDAGQPYHNLEMVTFPGGTRWLDTVHVPLSRVGDQVDSSLGVARDVTERKQAEEQLAIQGRIANIFLRVHDDEMFSEVLKVILEVMQSRFGVFGYLDEEGALVVPSMTRDIWDECNVPEKSIVFPRATWGDTSWPRCIREKQPNYSNEVSDKTLAGYVDVRRHVSFPILFQGEVIGLLQVANRETDYTQDDVGQLATLGAIIAPVLDARLKRQRVEAARLRAIADLERSNRDLEQFAYVASHDLQEPLRMISSFTQLLSESFEGRLDEKTKKYIDFVVDGAVRMQRLIQDLLVFSRVGRRGQPIEPTDSQRALGEATRSLTVAIEESRALVTSDALPTVVADAEQLVQLFQNLLGNGIKFRRDEVPRIHVSAHDSGREWVFAFEDNGIGIDPKHADRVFVIFQRLHVRSEYPGTGIGLAVCKRIVERHGGRIWFESEPGKGSTFFFTIPKGEKE